MTKRRAAAIVLAAATIALSGCASKRSGGALPESSSNTPGSPAATSSSAGGGAGSSCAYESTPSDPAPPGKDVGQPTGAEPVSGTVTLHTNQGDLKVRLARTAPCTSRSFAHLAEKKFFDGTTCHRLTTTEGLKVLQCGDPSGTGQGGPGYTIPDENPTDLKPGPTLADGSRTAIYPRGVVAMANTGAPHSGGSQFFLVYGDSTLQPNYAIFGLVDDPGLAILDKVAAAGAQPVNGPGDGTPTSAVMIQQAVLGA